MKKLSTQIVIVGVIVLVLAIAVVSGGGFMMWRGQQAPPPLATAPTASPVAKPDGYYQSRTTAPLPAPAAERDMLGDDQGVSQNNAPDYAAPVAKPETASPVMAQGPEDKDGLRIGKVPGKMQVMGAGFQAGQRLPMMSTCYRSNQSPGLSWSNAPAGTKSFVILFQKIEKEGPNTVYWVLYDVPGSMTAVPANITKAADVAGVGRQSKNYSANPGYIGPCIPRGVHDFMIRVFALNTVLNIAGGGDASAVIKAMNGHILDIGTLAIAHYYKM